MKALYKKELDYYLNSPVGYIIVVLFAVFANFFYIKDIFVVGSGSLQPFFSVLPWFFLAFIPAISMRIFAEEKRLNTVETLLTLPLSEISIIIAKYLALLTVFLIGLALTLALPLSLGVVAHLYLPEVFAGYIGVFLLGSAFIAVAMFFSSLTKNQVVAFLGSVCTLFILLVLSSDFLGTVLPKAAQDALTFFGPLYHLQNFVKGVVDIRSLIYFLSLSLLFLFLTAVVIEKRD